MQDPFLKLVKTLSKAEAATVTTHFRRLGKGAITSFKLFQAARKLKSGNSAELRSQFKELANFAQAKQNASNSILSALAKARNGQTSQLQQLLAQAEILQEKELWNESLELLKDALEIAKEQELFGMGKQIIANIFHIQETARLEGVKLKGTDLNLISDLEEQFEENDTSISILEKILRTVSPSEITPQLENQIKKKLSDSKFKNSTRGIILVNKILFFLEYFKSNYEKALQHLVIIKDAYEKNPELLADILTLTSFVKSIFNQGIIYLILGDINSANAILFYLKSVRTKFHKIPGIIDYRILLLKINIETVCCNEKAAAALVVEYNQFIETNPDYEINDQRIPFNLAKFYISSGQPKIAVRFLVGIINNFSSDWEVPLARHSFILFLIAHHDLNNHDVVFEKLNENKKMISTHFHPHTFEFPVVNYLKRLQSINTNKHSNIQTLISDLNNNGFLNADQKITNYFDFTVWAKSVLGNKSVFRVKNEEKIP